MLTAVAAAALASKPVRDRIATILPIDADNPVHAFALVLAVILLGTQLASTFFTNVLAADQAAPPITVVDLFTQEAPFLVFAFAGVGLYMRRGAKDAAVRLGLTLPAWWQIALALAAAGLFFVVAQVTGYLSETLTPTTARQVDATAAHVFSALDNPLGTAAIALLPGICEEILFRGALQPRFGLIVPAVLFTGVHTEYGASIVALTVLALAVGLGLIRRYTNTTTSCICHISYNLLVGIGIGGALLVPALAAEGLLIALAAYGVWGRRRQGAALAENAEVR
jgi:membrane protease YdiL (CAAX protease family)